MRRAWIKTGACGYYIRAFLYVFTMQAVFSLIINSSALLVSIWSPKEDFTVLDYVGAGVWTFGFLFEVIGDS